MALTLLMFPGVGRNVGCVRVDAREAAPRLAPDSQRRADRLEAAPLTSSRARGKRVAV